MDSLENESRGVTAQIRPAAAHELADVLDLLERSQLPTAGLAEHADNLLVAVDCEKIVGSAALETYGAAALLRSVAVDPALPGRGLGVTETAANFFNRLGFHPISRAEAEPAVGRSIEFTFASPQSATCMVLALQGPGAGAPR